MDALLEHCYVKIDEQTDRHIKQTHVAQKLRFVHRMQCLDGLEFHLGWIT